jgi:hypothetical protein
MSQTNDHGQKAGRWREWKPPTEAEGWTMVNRKCFIGGLRVSLIFMAWILAIAATANAEEMGKMNPETALPTAVAGWVWDGKEAAYNAK